MTRLPGLSDYDQADDAAWPARQAREPHGDNREPSTRRRAIAAFGCWCGDTYGHVWDGKADGAPHPRLSRSVAINPAYLKTEPMEVTQSE